MIIKPYATATQMLAMSNCWNENIILSWEPKWKAKYIIFEPINIAKIPFNDTIFYKYFFAAITRAKIMVLIDFFSSVTIFSCFLCFLCFLCFFYNPSKKLESATLDYFFFLHNFRANSMTKTIDFTDTMIRKYIK
jgi:cbb3-type cytochrome oxidase subunit 3